MSTGMVSTEFPPPTHSCTDDQLSPRIETCVSMTQMNTSLQTSGTPRSASPLQPLSARTSNQMSLAHGARIPQLWCAMMDVGGRHRRAARARCNVLGPKANNKWRLLLLRWGAQLCPPVPCAPLDPVSAALLIIGPSLCGPAHHTSARCLARGRTAHGATSRIYLARTRRRHRGQRPASVLCVL